MAKRELDNECDYLLSIYSKCRGSSFIQLPSFKWSSEGVYNATQGGGIHYKNPNQTTELTAQMDSPSDKICNGRNQLIIVGDRRV